MPAFYRFDCGKPALAAMDAVFAYGVGLGLLSFAAAGP
jgi:hypothetical protein